MIVLALEEREGWGATGNLNVNLHRSRGNEKDKLLSGVKPRSNDQQTSTLDTEPPDKSLSPYSPGLVTAVVVV